MLKYESVCDSMMNYFSNLAYPLCLLYVIRVWCCLFAMIINLLMWADARTSHGQQDNGDSAA